MEYVGPQIENYLAHASGIRKMFEAGIELKKKYGEDAVCDFSLGNPDLPPPAAVKSALAHIASAADRPFALGYMPNAGFPELRAKLAARLAVEQESPVEARHTILTCGAAGGINVFFRTVLAPGDEVLTFAPYFVEYDFYAANSGGVLRTVPTEPDTFAPDFGAFEAALTAKTRAVILNSPNNPTGRIYSADELARLGELICAAEKKYNRVIYVLSDEPYRILDFDGGGIPPVFRYFPHAAVIGSYSKSLSLAGERIGFIAVNPAIAGAEKLMNGLILCNRILGFVNAPVLAQRILLEALDATVDLEVYRRRRTAMAEVLDGAGIDYTMPAGAFYFFPKSPVPDEREFIAALLEERILGVPGRSFGGPGYFRLAFCVDEKVIRRAGPGFQRAAAACRAK